jgi:hypothetical protein
MGMSSQDFNQDNIASYNRVSNKTVHQCRTTMTRDTALD